MFVNCGSLTIGNYPISKLGSFLVYTLAMQVAVNSDIESCTQYALLKAVT